MPVTGHVTGQIIASLALVSHAVTVTQLPVSNPEDCQLLGGRDASSVIAVSPDRGYASYIVGVPKKCPGEEVWKIWTVVCCPLMDTVPILSQWVR